MSLFLPARHCLAVWLLCCLALAGCAPKQLSSSAPDNNATLSGSQQSGIYLPPDDGKPLSPEEMDALISVGDFDRTVSGEDMIDVVLHFKYYLHQGRRTVEKNVERGELYLPYIRSVLQQERLPQELAYLPFIESGYDTQARSRTGALGMWQFVKGTGKAYGMRRDWWSDERYCPYQSTQAAATYLSKLNRQFKDWHLAITAYNAGEGRVSRALSASNTKNFFDLRRNNNKVPEKDRLTDENKQYLPRFLAVCKIMRNLKDLGFRQPHSANARQVSEVSVRPGTDLMAMSRRLGMNWNEFSSYNPAYLRYVSPPDRSGRVFVPERMSAEATAFARNADRAGNAGWIKYTVQKGDTYARIASRTGVPAAELRRVNQVSEPLKTGKVLRIPGGGSPSTTTAVASAPAPAPVSEARPQSAKASASAPTPAARSGGSYTVRAGDTVYSLARSWDVDPDDVLRANKMNNSSLSVGQKLIIPGGTGAGGQPAQAQAAPAARQTASSASASAKAVTYKVQAGDTVWAIARKFDVPPAQLLRANNMTASTRLKPGDTVRVVRN